MINFNRKVTKAELNIKFYVFYYETYSFYIKINYYIKIRC